MYSYSSVKILVHWFQLYSSKYFQMYDETLMKSTRGYTSIVPPIYDLGQINCPIAIFWGGRDNIPNTQFLLKTLPKDKLKLVQCQKNYEHLDFMWAKNAKKDIFEKIIKLYDEQINN